MTKENIELLSRPVLHMTIWGVALERLWENISLKK